MLPISPSREGADELALLFRFGARWSPCVVKKLEDVGSSEEGEEASGDRPGSSTTTDAVSNGAAAIAKAAADLHQEALNPRDALRNADVDDGESHQLDAATTRLIRKGSDVERLQLVVLYETDQRVDPFDLGESVEIGSEVTLPPESAHHRERLLAGGDGDANATRSEDIDGKPCNLDRMRVGGSNLHGRRR
jgi:hypothetical protein